jgi:hypothetical protein
MIEVHYGVVRIADRWMVIGHGLRLGPYDSKADAERMARRLADQAAGLPVRLHLQGEDGELHQEEQEGESVPPPQ